jgi:TetR/AcrR family transcriptional regulator, cholesterol catabolism regulator
VRNAARSHLKMPQKSTTKGTRGRPPVYSRDEIVRAAKVAFSQIGYANVTLDQLATRLNTGKGTIYYHSSRKVYLLIAISRDFIGASIAELRRIQALRAPADVRFVMAMRAHMDKILLDQQASKVYFENEADLPRPIRTELRAVLREIETIFVRIVREGVQSGVFRSDDPVMMVRHAMAVCAWPYRWYSSSGRLSRADFIDTAIDFALSALRTGPLNSVVAADIKSSRRGRNSKKTVENS